eukprot:TRINITY_DN34550_c0_g1_i1.p1 TRINITY_DN34550_c0_g1~~TRINITY_DN34550_c0_g1_i1.p1  ORF type:complete len:418 (-),score=56.07 TRINITY_DN34550_c0_g1_i1:75-1328(-)
MLSLPLLGIVLSLLQEIALRATCRRVQLSSASLSKRAPDLFGVSSMIPDRHPIAEQADQEMDSEAWAEVEAAILERLEKIKSGSEENICWVSHEEILNGEGRIVEGGVAAVVEKQNDFRINFYQLEKFRAWLRVKELDIGTNKNFADEKDVWIVRLTDESHESEEPLTLSSVVGVATHSAQDEGNVFRPDRAERSAFLRSSSFARFLPVPQAGQEQLIPSLVTQEHEVFTFGFRTVSSMFHRKWQWDIFEAHMGQGTEDIPFAGGPRGDYGRVVLRGRCSRLPVISDWIVSDASDTDLFSVQSSPDGSMHRLMSISSSEILFTVRVQPDNDPSWGAAELVVKVFKGDEDTVLYTARTDRLPSQFLIFFRGDDMTTNQIAGVVPYGEYDQRNASRKVLHADEFSDSALLLVVTALMLE